MNLFASFLDTLSNSALDTLADFDRDAALQAGVDPARVADWQRVHDAYFGPTNSPQKQRIAREKALRAGFSLDQLVLIERRIKHISNKRLRAKLRLSLLDATSAARATYKALAAFVKAHVPARDTPPRKQVGFSRSRRGTRTMTVTADERDLADLEHALRRGIDPSKPAAPQMLTAFLQLMRGDGAETGVPRSAPRPLLLIPLPDYVSILRGEGDDTVLGLTDGTTMTGSQFLNEHFATPGNGLEAALFHPAEGAVNLYRTERLANQKQRDLARAVTPTCASPDCRHGADASELHHVTAWSRGGETNVNNLAPLCRYHNRVNDDDPSRAKRGRIEMVSGAPVWVSPRGYRVRNNHHPYGAMRALFGV